jgi:hypothetical protein
VKLICSTQGLGLSHLKRLAADQVSTLASMMANNFSRKMQILAHPAVTRAKSKRPTVWKSQRLDTIRHQIIQRARCFSWLQGKLTLTMSSNRAVKKDLLHFMDALQKAA